MIGSHFHPTSKLFTEKILANEPVEYDGNPLDDFTVKRFLDRFVFRNPKQNVKNTRKPLDSRTKVFGREHIKSGQALGEKELLEQPKAAIPADEQYIYQFLQQKQSLRLKERGGFDGDDDSDIESVDSLEFNDVLENYESYANDDDEVEDIDFAKNYQETKKSTSKKSKKNKKGEDDGNSENVDDDSEPDFDDDMFGDFDDDEDIEMSDVSDLDGAESGDDEDDFESMDFGLNKGKKANKARNAAPFAGKKGFSKITNDIFADAEEFSHLLEQNESDSDFELDDDDDAGDLNKSKKTNGKKSGKVGSKKPGGKNASAGKKRKHRPNLGRKAALRKKPKMVDL